MAIRIEDIIAFPGLENRNNNQLGIFGVKLFF
jgi:hypothetical protein